MKILNENANIVNIEKVRQLDEQIRKENSIAVYKSYAAFPIIRGGKYSDKYVIEYALLTSKALYVCNFCDDGKDAICDYQDTIYTLIESTLKKTPTMVVRRNLICDIFTITISTALISFHDENYNICHTIADVLSLIISIEKSKNTLDEVTLRKINAALQGAYGTVKRERREYYPGTKSEIINKINDYIESYDDDQFRAIVTDAKGIQRIRGMAGSGKTIIIARKAVQLYIDHPDWNIVVTYSTRSQRNQLYKLIHDYYEKLTDEATIDDSKLRIMHAWGSPSANGLYYEICLHNEIQALSLNDVKNRFHSSKNALSNACGLILSEKKSLKKEYDCILIDEAQDFKSDFFRLCLRVVKDDRIVYAYDELQNLGGETMENPKGLFGKEINCDTPLRVCYRNQGKVIVAAHALGMGIYRHNELPIQMPRTLDVWDSIGYNSEGELKYGNNVTLYRPIETSPDVIKIDTPVNFIKFDTAEEQFKYIADNIKQNLINDHLLSKDIIIIDLDTFNAESNFVALKMNHRDLQFHYAGKANPEDFFRDDSIVYSSIFRAKGNEAYVVYIINAQQVINNIEPITLRNALFTAMTRSKGWVTVVGYGDSMNMLLAEFQQVKENNYKLVFSPYPTEDQLKKIRTYNDDLSKSEKDAFKKTREAIKKLLIDNKRDPLLVAQDLFGVQTKEELLRLLNGEKDDKK